MFGSSELPIMLYSLLMTYMMFLLCNTQKIVGLGGFKNLDSLLSLPFSLLGCFVGDTVVTE